MTNASDITPLPPDEQACLDALRRGEEPTDGDALRRLAHRFRAGDGVTVSTDEYIRCLQIAAEKCSHPKAAAEFGWCCEIGIGVGQSYARATGNYRVGAEGGDAEAAYNLGWLYEHRYARPTFYASDAECLRAAIALYRQAAAAGQTKARERLERLDARDAERPPGGHRGP